MMWPYVTGIQLDLVAQDVGAIIWGGRLNRLLPAFGVGWFYGIIALRTDNMADAKEGLEWRW